MSPASDARKKGERAKLSNADIAIELFLLQLKCANVALGWQIGFGKGIHMRYAVLATRLITPLQFPLPGLFHAASKRNGPGIYRRRGSRAERTHEEKGPFWESGQGVDGKLLHVSYRL